MRAEHGARTCAAAAMAALLLASACRFGGPDTGSEAEPVPTAPVVRGPFRVTIEEVGVLRARDAHDVKAPFGGQVAKVVEEGSRVEKGEPVLWLDTEELETNLAQLEADLRAAASEREKQLERIAYQGKSTALDVRTSEAQLDFEKRKLEKARSDDADAQRQLGLGLISASARERAAQALRDAEMSAEKTRFAHEQKVEEVRGQQRQTDVDRQEAERTYGRTLQRRDEVTRMIASAVVLAPASGEVFLPKNSFRGGEERKVRVGDQVGPWRGTLLQIPERTKLEVRSQIDEALMQKVAAGTPAEVRVTAIEGLMIPARARAVDFLAVNRSKSEGAGFSDREKGSIEQVVFPVTLDLERPDDRLQPGMTVGVSFVLQVLDDVVSVPEDAVLGTPQEPVAYVKSGAGHERRVLELGPASNGRVVVVSGLAEGELVSLGDPREAG